MPVDFPYYVFQFSRQSGADVSPPASYLFQAPMTGDFPNYVFNFWCQSGADVSPPASYFYRRKEI